MRTNPATSDLSSVLATLAADCLKVPPCDLARRVPLARYGMDSLATEEFRAALEQAFGRRLPESVFTTCPDLESLDRYLTQPVAEEGAPLGVRELMMADARLPDDIRPAGNNAAARQGDTVLLSGATGFLGAYLLRSLLKRSRSTVYCLARSTIRESAMDRIRNTMHRYGIWDPCYEPRLRAIEGDLSLPRMGIGQDTYASLLYEIDAIYHCAATVNWVHPYAALRQVNVLGTREMLRLACALRSKPFHFVSSAAVCYSTWGPLEVDENCDAFSYLDGLHLGYAQSKSVAEALVRQAGERGLPVTVHRPSLIAGDRVSGSSNLDDLLSRLIKGIITMGTAPDLDWSLDCCPVDYVADAMVHLSTVEGARRVSHLVNPAPRHWRELVLWINLFGYPVRLLPYREWLEQLQAEAGPGHPLRGLLAFFAREPEGEGGLTLPELYEDSRRSRLQSVGTALSLRGSDIGSPGLNAHLLDRYFRHYIDQGFLSPTGFSGRPRPSGDEIPFDAGFYSTLMRRSSKNPGLEVCAVQRVQKEGGHSIISELSSWKHGGITGIERHQLTIAQDGKGQSLKAVVVKRKARDEQLVDTAVQIAGLCGAELGEAFRRFGHDIGLVGSHLREIGIYQQKDERFLRHVPALYGTRSDNSREMWALVLEDISGLELLNTADHIDGWRPAHIEAAILGIAELHSIWFRREAELLSQPWLGPVISSCRREQMHDLWAALAENAAARFGQVIGTKVRSLQGAMLAEVRSRWLCLEQLPRTLLHNDFNPRNIAFRREGERLRLCAYDWELATLGVPQHDLAELLCFVLQPGVQRTEVMHYLNLHRLALGKVAQVAIDPVEWQTGFCLSLHDLLVDRFAMYAMIDRFCPQRFLTRVVSTWQALYEMFPLEEVAAP